MPWVRNRFGFFQVCHFGSLWGFWEAGEKHRTTHSQPPWGIQRAKWGKATVTEEIWNPYSHVYHFPPIFNNRVPHGRNWYDTVFDSNRYAPNKHKQLFLHHSKWDLWFYFVSSAQIWRFNLACYSMPNHNHCYINDNRLLGIIWTEWQWPWDWISCHKNY